MSEREPWTMPGWMEPYRELIGNTGGNSVEELMNDFGTRAESNLIRAVLIECVRAQVALLYRLHPKGWLVDLNDPALCGYCFHHADLHTYGQARATATGVVPCVQCPGEVCPRPMPVIRRTPPRCDARARKGTGEGICDRLLDEHSQCDRASDHI